MAEYEAGNLPTLARFERRLIVVIARWPSTNGALAELTAVFTRDQLNRLAESFLADVVAMFKAVPGGRVVMIDERRLPGEIEVSGQILPLPSLEPHAWWRSLAHIDHFAETHAFTQVVVTTNLSPTLPRSLLYDLLAELDGDKIDIALGLGQDSEPYLAGWRVGTMAPLALKIRNESFWQTLAPGRAPAFGGLRTRVSRLAPWYLVHTMQDLTQVHVDLCRQGWRQPSQTLRLLAG